MPEVAPSRLSLDIQHVKKLRFVHKSIIMAKGRLSLAGAHSVRETRDAGGQSARVLLLQVPQAVHVGPLVMLLLLLRVLVSSHSNSVVMPQNWNTVAELYF